MVCLESDQGRVLKLCLIGAGGHAKSVADAVKGSGHHIVAYCDRSSADWLDAIWIRDDADIAALPDDVALVLGIGGVTPMDLRQRSSIFTELKATRAAPAIIHARALISETAIIGDGAHIMVGSIINSGASIGDLAIINSGAIVEHDAVIGHGSHVGPGAIILGKAVVEPFAMIGAGAVVLPGHVVKAESVVRAASLATSTLQ